MQLPWIACPITTDKDIPLSQYLNNFNDHPASPKTTHLLHCIITPTPTKNITYTIEHVAVDPSSDLKTMHLEELVNYNINSKITPLMAYSEEAGEKEFRLTIKNTGETSEARISINFAYDKETESDSEIEADDFSDLGDIDNSSTEDEKSYKNY